MTTTVHRMDDRVAVYHGDCRDALALLPDACVDAVVTDPPYELGFMGKGWDGTGVAYDSDLWRECLRVLKPGGHLLSFGGTRTWHRLAVAIEDAGFEMRDSIAWLYGSGFPKSLDVSKAIDKAAGAEREVVGTAVYGDGHVQRSAESIGYHGSDPARDIRSVTAPATDAARQWQGWGTALKPAFEPVVVARKPLIGTVAANVLAHGVGALNVDGCRIEHASADDLATSQAKNPGRTDTVTSDTYGAGRPQQSVNTAGRWPANVTLDEAAVVELDEQSGRGASRKGKPRRSAAPGEGYGMTATGAEYDDTGGASRFFYVAKAPTKERPKVDGVAHPTVKPLALMRWLVRLVTPPGGIVLDPFAGSGTTVEAALGEGFRVIACELTPEYLPLIDARIARVGIVDEGVA